MFPRLTTRGRPATVRPSLFLSRVVSLSCLSCLPVGWLAGFIWLCLLTHRRGLMAAVVSSWLVCLYRCLPVFECPFVVSYICLSARLDRVSLVVPSSDFVRCLKSFFPQSLSAIMFASLLSRLLWPLLPTSTVWVSPCSTPSVCFVSISVCMYRMSLNFCLFSQYARFFRDPKFDIHAIVTRSRTTCLLSPSGRPLVGSVC